MVIRFCCCSEILDAGLKLKLQSFSFLFMYTLYSRLQQTISHYFTFYCCSQTMISHVNSSPKQVLLHPLPLKKFRPRNYKAWFLGRRFHWLPMRILLWNRQVLNYHSSRTDELLKLG